MPYMSDPTIVPRVQKYLESNVDKTYVDINVMADDLQRQYREYSKRKRSVFRAAVNKAYSIVLQSYGLDEENSDGVQSDDSSIDPGDHKQDQLNNSMNNQMVSLYRKLPTKVMDENELIDISSDEDEGPPAVRKEFKQQQPIPPTQPTLTQPAPVNKNGTQQPVDPNRDGDRGKKRKLDYATVVKYSQTKKKKQVVSPQELGNKFKDIGGMDKTLEEVCKLLLHITHPEIYNTIGITPPRGFLLHGPPGCGKTLLANAIAGELNVPLMKVAAPELVAGVSGESEERIRELFQQSSLLAPCVLFIDEIDAITPNRQNAQKDMEKRIVAQLLSCLDDLNKEQYGSRVLVIGATNRPDSIDPALRRAGRFDREISLGIPNKESRSQILKVLTRKLKLSENFDFDRLASLTPGYVGADLLSLAREAAMTAVNRLIREIKENHKTTVETPVAEKEKEKDSPEIIVEDDVPIVEDDVPIVEDVTLVEPTSEAIPESTSDATTVEVAPEKVTPPEPVGSPVVVIDDDCFSKASKSADVEPKQMTDELPKKLSPLEEVLIWLHDQLPLSQQELAGLCITLADFEAALKCVQPSAKREGFATVPDTTWDDIGSLTNIREELQLSIVAPVRHTEQFEKLGINIPTGVLLFGPPGCGKTLLAKAIANEAGINFISVKGPELLNMYVGESERAVRVCFERARNSSPCVIFFDELDALCPKRSANDSSSTSRVVNQLLTEMDGVGGRKGVFLLAATNRPDMIDPAVLRPGRLDKILYVGLPLASDRTDILRAITKNGTCPKLSPEVSLEAIAESGECEGFTGADLAALVRESGVMALKDLLCGANLSQDVVVTSEHFKRAFGKIRGSVSEKDRQYYEKLRKMYSSDRKDSQVEEMELS
ncbi:nuclear valosin-containing protein-like smid [Leptinotarsa decemlineata]|uniref:nuclear valosin-containing protein-like smid n=1 Tax=Leptinotarsa decemlineata TaxID=7539 RepID=UPI003D309896